MRLSGLAVVAADVVVLLCAEERTLEGGAEMTGVRREEKGGLVEAETGSFICVVVAVVCCTAS